MTDSGGVSVMVDVVIEDVTICRGTCLVRNLLIKVAVVDLLLTALQPKVANALPHESN